MNQSRFPPGWDEARFRRVLEYYEEQTKEEALAHDKAAFEDHLQISMEVPNEFVPIVRELIARH